MGNLRRLVRQRLDSVTFPVLPPLSGSRAYFAASSQKPSEGNRTRPARPRLGPVTFPVLPPLRGSRACLAASTQKPSAGHMVNFVRTRPFDLLCCPPSGAHSPALASRPTSLFAWSPCLNGPLSGAHQVWAPGGALPRRLGLMYGLPVGGAISGACSNPAFLWI